MPPRQVRSTRQAKKPAAVRPIPTSEPGSSHGRKGSDHKASASKTPPANDGNTGGVDNDTDDSGDGLFSPDSSSSSSSSEDSEDDDTIVAGGYETSTVKPAAQRRRPTKTTIAKPINAKTRLAIKSVARGPDPSPPKLNRRPPGRRDDTVSSNHQQRAWRRRNTLSLACYVREVIRAAHPGCEVSRTAISVVDTLLADTLGRLGAEAGFLAQRRGGGAVMGARDVEVATRLVLKGEIAEHAVKQARRRLAKLGGGATFWT